MICRLNLNIPRVRLEAIDLRACPPGPLTTGSGSGGLLDRDRTWARRRRLPGPRRPPRFLQSWPPPLQPCPAAMDQGAGAQLRRHRRLLRRAPGTAHSARSSILPLSSSIQCIEDLTIYLDGSVFFGPPPTRSPLSNFYRRRLPVPPSESRAALPTEAPNGRRSRAAGAPTEGSTSAPSRPARLLAVLPTPPARLLPVRSLAGRLAVGGWWSWHNNILQH
ncbi:hypothetical protein SEVIR_4G300101v4 [Setaria viridis]